ncbi:MAG: hypothetical protein KJ709_09085 [Nanoarchaeota archaeon]|nr:hypothetical protein [Nanoarchaeota archaeon]
MKKSHTPGRIRPKRKAFEWLIIALCLTLASPLASAAFIDDVGSAAGGMFEGFFNMYSRDADGSLDDNFQLYRKVVDFIVFFAIFLAITFLGLGKALGEKGSGAVKGLAIAVALALALSLVTFTNFGLGALFPFAKNILFFILFILLYFLLAKIPGLEKRKWLAFILAVLIAVAVYFLYSFGTGGGMPFSGLTDRLKGIGEKKEEAPPIQSGESRAEYDKRLAAWEEELARQKAATQEKPEAGQDHWYTPTWKKGGWGGGIGLAIVLLFFAGRGIRRRRRREREERLPRLEKLIISKLNDVMTSLEHGQREEAADHIRNLSDLLEYLTNRKRKDRRTKEPGPGVSGVAKDVTQTGDKIQNLVVPGTISEMAGNTETNGERQGTDEPV